MPTWRRRKMRRSCTCIWKIYSLEWFLLLLLGCCCSNKFDDFLDEMLMFYDNNLNQLNREKELVPGICVVQEKEGETIGKWDTLELLIEKLFKKQTSDTVNITASILSDMVTYFGFAYLNYTHTFAEENIYIFHLWRECLRRQNWQNCSTGKKREDFPLFFFLTFTYLTFLSHFDEKTKKFQF